MKRILFIVAVGSLIAGQPACNRHRAADTTYYQTLHLPKSERAAYLAREAGAAHAGSPEAGTGGSAPAGGPEKRFFDSGR